LDVAEQTQTEFRREDSVVWLGTRQLLTKLTISQLPLSSSAVDDLLSNVTNLGVLDGQLTCSGRT